MTVISSKIESKRTRAATVMKTRILSQVLVCVVSLHLELLVVAAEGTKIKDSESASHGAEDALHQVVDTYRFPGFEIVQFNLPVLSHYSYLLVSGPEALLVDPDRDINAYLDYAKKNNLTIKGVFLTHSHADFVAGHLETVRALHVPIYQNAASGAQYKIEPLQEGSTFRVGKATVKAITTPGHTPDGMCGLVSSRGGSAAARRVHRRHAVRGVDRAAGPAGRHHDRRHAGVHELRHVAQQTLQAAGLPSWFCRRMARDRCAAPICLTIPPRRLAGKGRRTPTCRRRAAANSSRRCWRGCRKRRSISSTTRP